MENTRGGGSRERFGSGRVGSGRIQMDRMPYPFLSATPKSLESRNTNWRRGTSSSSENFSRGATRDFGSSRQKWSPNSTHQPRNSHRRMDFQYLNKLASDTVEPSEVIRCLADPNNDLASHLKKNASNIEYLELVLVALGGFCKKSGTAQFTGYFVNVVKTLADQKVFAQIPSMLFNIPISRAINLLNKEQRLQRLTNAVYHVATEIIVLMPAFGCHILGKNFFTDIVSLKLMPSIQSLNAADAFVVLENGIPLLEAAWKQHVPENIKEDVHRVQKEQYAEELSLQDPPNDFRTLNIMPSFEDVCVDVEPFLRPNIVKGVYPDVSTYLDIQFRLLREDFFNPLRLALLAHRNQADRKSSRAFDNIRLYQQVKFLSYDMNEDTYKIKFSITHLRKIKWENSKRFLYGSLLLLSSDQFSSFHLFTVTDRNPTLLAEGVIKLKLECCNLSANEKKQTFVMAESTVFFESYRSVLAALQKISPAHFPLKEYILGQKTYPERPDYLLDVPMPMYYIPAIATKLEGESKEVIHDSEEVLNLEETDQPNEMGEAIVNLTEDQRLGIMGQIWLGIPNPTEPAIQQVSICDPENRLNANDLGLDPSQTEAFYAALTQKVSVIQGPPGTGKTYVGLRIVQTLLDNKTVWFGTNKKTPILVICYTNHALDQFLEGISKFTNSIVRIGSQSKCAALEQYSLMALKKRGFHTRNDTRSWIFEINDTLRQLDEQRKALQGTLSSMDLGGLIHENTLFNLEVIPESVQKMLNYQLELLGAYSVGKTAMGWWLQIYSNDELEQAVKFLSRNGLYGSVNRPASKNSLQTNNKVCEKKPEEDNNEYWDKEEIDNLEAARKVEDDDDDDEDDYLTTLREMKTSNNLVEDSKIWSSLYLDFSYKSIHDEMEIANLKEYLTTVEGEDEVWLQRRIFQLQTRQSLVRQLLQIAPQLDDNQLNDLMKRDLAQIPLVQRWMMYNTWKRKAIDHQEEVAAKIEKEYQENAQRLKDVRNLESAEICENAQIVGFTTTGAAKQRALLNHLKPKIVIVEEAAEVLEAHVTCALSSACQQLILIGDHQQLRPSVTVHRLAREFFLDVSLFERLIRNGMEPCVLGVQHRMRPEIARLIVPSIYPRLENHSSVLAYPSIRGMSTDVFFLSHNELERGDYEGKSHLNPYEADMSLALARHLMMQGYSPKQITILTTYSGQLLHFFKLKRDLPVVQSVRISVVDNFQGEENDIIILSLVRSNEDENIGFLRVENRVCVALSRAKHGFYIIGNMQNLQAKSKLWAGIGKDLDSAGQIGPDFLLKCQSHNTIIKARNTTDFPPEGGCMEKCATLMPCGHNCPKICHSSDRDHLNFACRENCIRSCSRGHPCPKKCFEDCQCFVKVTQTLPCSHDQLVMCYKKPSRCEVEVTRTLPKCSHDQLVKCFKDPKLVFCNTKVWRKIPVCGHGVDLLCGIPLGREKCPEPCGKKLDCGHTCPLKCHDENQHEGVVCEQPCQRKCENQHACPNECGQDCGQCQIKMEKILPCGHKQEMVCHEKPHDIFCNVKVIKPLPNCEHSVEIECGRSTEDYKCEKLCEKILCGDEHSCKKRCFEPCGNCLVRVTRELKCEHSRVVECFVNPLSIKCHIRKECKLPPCGHVVTIRCGEDPEEAYCSSFCDMRLECGHTCTLKCHVKKDPNHEEYKCMKPCGKTKLGCKKDHKCSKKCFEDCDVCTYMWNRTLPCGHKSLIECHYRDEEVICSHLEEKTISECGHSVIIPCSTEPVRDECKKMCAQVLPCGHKCKKPCKEACNQLDCIEPVATSSKNICGHEITMKCRDYHKLGGMPSEKDIKSHLQNCLEPCGTMLDCSHVCKGTCGQCFNGRVHQACHEECGRSLVCGHICNVNCGLTCPPCRSNCQYSCAHSKCNHKCCERCSPCQEPCQWKCEHQTCTRKCGESCNRTRCDEPCKKILSCSHPCAGLCGEICPPLCRVCDKDKLTEFILLGNEEDDDAKFVFLSDCGHSIEVEGMDHWMVTDGGGQIQPKCCPRCKTIILDCMRYGDLIKNTFEDIAKAKKKILDLRSNPMEFFKKAREQLSKCTNLKTDLLLCDSIAQFINNHLGIIDQQIRKKKKKGKDVNPCLDPSSRFQIEVDLDFIERVLRMFHNKKRHVYDDNGLPQVKMKQEFLGDFNEIALKLLHLVINRQRISQKEYQDATRELDRLEYLRAFFILQSAPTFPALGTTATETQVVQKLLIDNVRLLEDGHNREIRAALEALGKKLKTGLGISDQERKTILSAMGLTKGHWYKCPNGHIYVIDACGGAMQESRCNECHARIGGANHRLLGDNSVASEMDGAERPAWPP